MENWGEFYYLCGSAAAGLTGLMFIAVTFGSRLITKEKLPAVETFITPICYHFVQVFLLSAVALIPSAAPRILGAAIIVTAVWRVAKLPGHLRMIRITSHEAENDIETSDWMLGIWLPAATYLLMIAAGGAYLLGYAASQILFATSLIALLMIALRNAWDMLIWMATKVD